MAHDPDFENMLRNNHKLVSVNITYYMPDYPSIVQEFFWQTLDLTPEYPRIHRFLNFWQREIDAVIKEIQLCDSEHLKKTNWRNGLVFNYR